MKRIVIACPNLSLDRTIQVPSIAIGAIHRSLSADTRGGGKGVNVARALCRLGRQASVIGMSAGRTGGAVTSLLADEGIDVHTAEIEGETRSCLTVLAPGSTTVFNESGPAVSQRSWDHYEEMVAEELSDEVVFVCSGSFPPGAPEDAAARLVERGKAVGALVILDVAREQLDKALASRPDVIKPNLAEALGVLEGDEDEAVEGEPGALERSMACAEALLDRGPEAVFVTAGAAGAALATGHGTRSFPGLEVEVVNPIGAGDTFVAGVALSLALGETLEAAGRRATAMAAASCELIPAGELSARRTEELLTSLGE